jgi:hypothetical protein
MRPSGSQVCWSGSYGQVPSRLFGGPPDAGTTYRRWLLVRVGALVNDTQRPSGDQATSPSLPLALVRRRGVPPPTGMTKMSASLRGASSRRALYGSRASESRSASTTESGRSPGSATKAIHCPSGETVALRREYAVLSIMRFFALPSSGCIHTCTGRQTRASRGPGRKPGPFAL